MPSSKPTAWKQCSPGALVALSLLLLFVGASVHAPRAGATPPDEEVLATNIYENFNEREGRSRYIHLKHVSVAQGFTTGGNPHGYILTSVELVLRGADSFIPETRAPTVTLITGEIVEDGYPGDPDDPTAHPPQDTLEDTIVVATLTTELTRKNGRSGVAGPRVIYTAPPGTILEPDSTYYIMVRPPSLPGDQTDPVSRGRLDGARDDTEISSPGFTIGDSYFYTFTVPGTLLLAREELESLTEPRFLELKGLIRDGAAPVPQSATVEDDILTLTYDEYLREDSVPAATAFSVSIDGASGVAPSSVALSGPKVTLTLPSPVTFDQTVTLTFTSSTTDRILDYSAYQAGDLDNHSVTNATPDRRPRVSFGATSYNVAEGAGVAITIELDADPGGTLAIPLVSVNQDGATGQDYSGVPASVTVSAGETVKTIQLTAADDAEDDDGESVQVQLGVLPAELRAGSITNTVVNIIDDDDPPVTVGFAEPGYNVTEGSRVSIKVQLSADPERSVTIPVVVSSASDAEAADYRGVPSSLTFGPGVTEHSFAFTAASDLLEDDGESVTLGFGASLPPRVSVDSARAATTVSIADLSGVAVNYGADAYSVDEGLPVAVTVALSATLSTDVTIPITHTPGTGASSSDYSGVPTSLTFTSGETELTFALEAAQDAEDDDGESVTLGFGTLPALVTEGASSLVTVAINDDDDPEVTVSFAQTAYTVPEGSFENIKVVLSEDPERDIEITLTVATEADGATDADYTLDPDLNPFTFTIESGQTEYTFTFRSTPDSEEDDGETVTISIAAPLPERVTAGANAEAVVTIEPRPVGAGFVGGGGGGGPSGPTPSEADFEWNVKRDIEQLDSTNDWPTDVCSDGETLWVAENGPGADDAVYAYSLATGERMVAYEFPLAATNRAPRGFWSGGGTAWVADSGQDRLFAYDLASGERVEALEIVLAERNRDVRGIWSDGETMWVLDDRDDALFAYDLESGDLLAEYALHDDNDTPHGIWSDGVTLWVSDHGAKRLFAYRLPVLLEGEPPEEPPALERVIDEELEEPGRVGNNSPRGIWSDGDVMYVADENDDKVYSYNMPAAIDARLTSLELSGVDFGEFSPLRYDYASETIPDGNIATLTAMPAQPGASVQIDPADHDGDPANGHHVRLLPGLEITVTVTSEDASRERVYRLLLGDEEASGPAASCLRGAVNPGFSLVVYEGGSLDDLVACAQGRHVTALYALSDGEYEPYIVGAPDFATARFRGLFPDGIPALLPLVVRSEGPATPAPAAPVVAEPFAVCLRGEIGEGFSLVVYEGGSVADLEACARSLGVTAVYALVEGEYEPYILGAPDFAIARFRALFADGVRAATPLTVRGGGS